MDTTRERIYREKNGTQQQQQRQKKTNDRYSMRRYWMTVLMQEGEKGWHIVQNRFHMVVALAYSKLCSALLCNNVYTIHHPHHPCTRCAVYSPVHIYGLCVREAHLFEEHHSLRTNILQSCRTDEQSFYRSSKRCSFTTSTAATTCSQTWAHTRNSLFPSIQVILPLTWWIFSLLFLLAHSVLSY